MNTDLGKKIIGDLKLLGMGFLAALLIYALIFFNEAAANVILLITGIYWLLVLPAFGITYLIEEMDFLERHIISIPLSSALVGISSYYLGILGMPPAESLVYAPAFFIFASVIMVFIKLKISKS